MINWQEAPKTWQETSKKLTGNVGLPFSLGALGTSTSALHPGTVYMKVEAAMFSVINITYTNDPHFPQHQLIRQYR